EVVGTVHVVDIVRRELVMADDLAGFRPDCDHARRADAVQAATRPRVVRFGIAGAPIDEVELGIVGARAPGRRAAVFPGVAVGRPGVVSGLAGPRNGVTTPELLAGLGIPAVKEAARRRFAAGHAGDQHAVGDDRRTGGVVAFLPV